MFSNNTIAFTKNGCTFAAQMKTTDHKSYNNEKLQQQQTEREKRFKESEQENDAKG